MPSKRNLQVQGTKILEFHIWLYAGPGVGVSNHQVQFRAVEKIRIENLDYFIQIHRASGDCHNPVEQTQASVGKEIANGSHIEWEHVNAPKTSLNQTPPNDIR